MKSKTLGGLLVKVVLFLSYSFSKKNGLCRPLPQRFEKTFTLESIHQKNSLE